MTKKFEHMILKYEKPKENTTDSWKEYVNAANIGDISTQLEIASKNGWELVNVVEIANLYCAFYKREADEANTARNEKKDGIIRVDDKVIIKNTGAKKLDGQYATIVGSWTADSYIIMFEDIPDGYDPAIVILNACIEKVI